MQDRCSENCRECLLVWACIYGGLPQAPLPFSKEIQAAPLPYNPSEHGYEPEGREFAALMSRWMMPCEWAASSASAISPNDSTVSNSIGRFAIRCFRVAPSKNSMTIKA